MRHWIFFTLLLTIILTGNGMTIPLNVKKLEIGSPAPNFNLPGVDDKNYTLENFKDADILVVIFTCNHCPTAQAYENRIIELVDDYKNKNVALVAISPNDPKAVRLDELGYTDLSDDLESMKIRAREHNFNFPYLYDGENQKVSMMYGPVSTPHVFIFDKGRLLRYTGRIDDSERINRIKTNDTRNALNALLKGLPVPVERTKTFGCSVKWSDKRDSVRKAFEDWAKEDVILEDIDLEGIKKLVKNDTENLLLLNMWATWCGPCVVEFPVLVEMNRMYRNREFKLVTLSVDDPSIKSKVLTFLKDKQASMTNYISTSDDIYKIIEIVDKEWQGSIPHTILIAPGGKIIYRHIGMIDDPLEVKKEIVNYLGRVYK
ncbi:redoxin domain-containing protein [candidate division KSB1 bacterium]|nr:redoxin domain-containing protein [candidate division KSB1 bacterium]